MWPENRQPYLSVGLLVAHSSDSREFDYKIHALHKGATCLYLVWQLQSYGGQNKVSICREGLWWRQKGIWNRRHPWAMAAPESRRSDVSWPRWVQGFQTALTQQILGEQRRWCCYLCRKQDTHCGGVAKSKATLRRRCLENGAQWQSGRWGVQKGRSLWESTVTETLLCPLLWTPMTWDLNNKCLGLTARFLFFFLFFSIRKR